jgi:hypothetical protein
LLDRAADLLEIGGLRSDLDDRATGEVDRRLRPRVTRKATATPKEMKLIALRISE